MKTNVICIICGHHHSVEGNVTSETYFPNKLVYVNGVNAKCPKCFDNHMIVENNDYIDMLGKSYNVEVKEFIRNSNQIYLNNEENKLLTKLNELKSSPAIVTTIFDINKINRRLLYIQSRKYLNSRL